jgi:prephenate dehydrogenase
MSGTGFHTRQLVVVGLGLMGGSLAMALRGHADLIVGVDESAQSREVAMARGIVDHATSDLPWAAKEADTVVLCAPVRVILSLVRGRLGAYLRSNTFVIDIGSTKEDICESMGQLPIGVQAIGGHPMTGKETSGIESSDAHLYKKRPFVLCPTRRTTPAARLRALSFVEALGAEAIEMDAHRHDRTVATISHLPYLLSAALVATVMGEGNKDSAVWQLAAGGFRDTSRLAASDLSMMGDILSTNTQAVAALLARFRAQLALLEAALIDEDGEEITELLRPVRQARIDWQHQYERKR